MPSYQNWQIFNLNSSSMDVTIIYRFAVTSAVSTGSTWSCFNFSIGPFVKNKAMHCMFLSLWFVILHEYFKAFLHVLDSNFIQAFTLSLLLSFFKAWTKMIVTVCWLFFYMLHTKWRNTESDRAIRQRQQNTRRVFSALLVCLEQMKPAGTRGWDQGTACWR